LTRLDVRLLACDLDGTLFGPDHLLSRRTIAAVQHAVAAGIHVVAATGRSTTSAVPRLRPAEVITTAVCSNGSLIHDMLSSDTVRFPIEPAHVDRFFAALTAIDNRYAFCWETDHGNGWDASFSDIASIHEDLGDECSLATRPTAEHRTTKLMVRHPEITQEALREHLVPLLVDPLTVSTSGVQFVEVTGEGITKASALAHLCTDWGIEPAQVIAFGDNHNDAAMLKWAGHGVAMGNGSSLALEAADEVIGSNADDAVAVFIESLLARN
tara:strand:+ start:1681 stop:2487 length:807 start_codon:yes stop_codon:yes gene_type:complete